MRFQLTTGLLAVFVLASCSSPPAIETPSSAAQTRPASSKEEAETVTGSRIPVRGAQPVRTIDKDEITRNTSVIGTPPKGN